MASEKTRLSRTLQTSDVGPSDVLPFEVPDNTGGQIHARIQGVSAGGTVAVYAVQNDFRRIGGGAAVDGAKSTLHAYDGITLAAAPDIIASGNDVYIRISGKAATVIDWYIDVDVYTVTPPE